MYSGSGPLSESELWAAVIYASFRVLAKRYSYASGSNPSLSRHANMGAIWISISLMFASIALWILVSRWREPRSPFPPGPEGMPILGNALHCMSLSRPWEKWSEWSKTYKSDVIYLDLPFQPTIIVGSAKAAAELFDKRSQLYSSRKRTIMIEMMTWDFAFAFMPYGHKWRAHRRMLHPHLEPGKVDQYKPAQQQHARAFLVWTMKDPEHTRQYVRQMVTSTIFFIAYGKLIPSMDHEYVVTAQRAVEGLSEISTPGIFLVEYLPFLRHIPSWVPGASARKLAERYQPYVAKTREEPFAEVEAAMQLGQAPASLVTTLNEDIEATHGGTKDEALQKAIAKNVAVTAYAGGADTTTCIAEFFLLAMALYPEVQRKAQVQLDDVVSQDRLPEFSDLNKMSYIHAVTMETLRWMPVAPFGVPHAVTDNDVYMGYHIPKGATVVPNIWAMTRDPRDYPDPESFKPERFLNNDGSVNSKVRDPSSIVFGFGRRICLGRHFALNSLAIYIASTLHVFNITAGIEVTSGKPIDLSTETEGSFVTMPRHVPCGLTPRSETAARLIYEAAAEIEGLV